MVDNRLVDVKDGPADAMDENDQARLVRSEIRRALPEEAWALSQLALRSKAYWGYDSAFVEDCRAALTLTPTEIASTAVYALEEDGAVVGFYGLRPLDEGVELAYLFVDADLIGCGRGRRLWRHAVETARELGYQFMLVESDPHAEGFYLAMGAERIGERRSPVRPGRLLPLLRYALCTSAEPAAERREPPTPDAGERARGRLARQEAQ